MPIRKILNVNGLVSLVLKNDSTNSQIFKVVLEKKIFKTDIGRTKMLQFFVGQKASIADSSKTEKQKSKIKTSFALWISSKSIFKFSKMVKDFKNSFFLT